MPAISGFHALNELAKVFDIPADARRVILDIDVNDVVKLHIIRLPSESAIKTFLTGTDFAEYKIIEGEVPDCIGLEK